MIEKQILAGVRKEFKKHIDEEYREGASRFFKEEVVVLGVRAGIVRKIARTYAKEMKGWEVERVFALCEELLKTGISEESIVAFEWATKQKQNFLPVHIKTFKRWLNSYADTWAKVDDLCTHIIGALVMMYPELTAEVKRWTKSKNRWMRRGSAVTFIYPAQQEQYLDDIFWIAETLMMDQDDLVQKGYGWMLKAAAENHSMQVYDFLLKHKAHMPRTALRYALEKYPEAKRKRAMKN